MVFATNTPIGNRKYYIKWAKELNIYIEIKEKAYDIYGCIVPGLIAIHVKDTESRDRLSEMAVKNLDWRRM